MGGGGGFWGFGLISWDLSLKPPSVPPRGLEPLRFGLRARDGFHRHR